MTKSVGVVLGDTGPASRVVMWNAPGWVVEKAGVVGAGVVVEGALESLASKTVAVSGCRCCRVAGGGGGGGVVEMFVGEGKVVLRSVRSEIAGTALSESGLKGPWRWLLSLVGRDTEDRRVENVDLEGKIRKASCCDFGGIDYCPKQGTQGGFVC